MRLRYLANRDGAAAVEFAMVFPVLVALTLGAMNLCLVLFTQMALNFAVDAGARCGAIACTTSALSTFTKSRYFGPALTNLAFSPTLVPTGANSNGTCNSRGDVDGYVVTATGTYNLNVFVGKYSIAMSATACYPVVT